MSGAGNQQKGCWRCGDLAPGKQVDPVRVRRSPGGKSRDVSAAIICEAAGRDPLNHARTSALRARRMTRVHPGAGPSTLITGLPFPARTTTSVDSSLDGFPSRWIA